MTPEAEQPRDLPPLPEPFPEPSATRPRDSESTRRGCLIAGFAGCGLLVLLLVIGMVVALTQADELLEFVLDFGRGRIMETLPEDTTSEERNRLDRAFDSVLERYRSRPATPADNRRLQMALTDALRRAERGLLDRDDVRRLTERLERIAASGPEV
ncbi:MAG: hypothetical protein OXG74_00100 [Acidobacteria bacterium]|nr:hypothetical protein [Acidobacteriota bacterium]